MIYSVPLLRAHVARQVDEFEHGAIGIVEIGAWPVDDTVLPVFLEGDLDAVLAQMVERGSVIFMRNTKGVMHPAVALFVPVNRRVALDQDHASTGGVEKRHPAAADCLQM